VTYQAFTDAMSELAGGVVIVTTRIGGRPWGMTATAFASVSADPPTVLVSLSNRSRALHAIRRAGRYGVSILAEHQLGVALHGARPGRDKFIDDLVADRAKGSPAIDGGLAHIDCDVLRTVEVGDHTVVVGLVRAADVRSGDAPLVYHRREYGLVSRLTERRLQWRVS